MKNILKIFAVVLVAAFLMVSCKEKGGIIEVKNGWSSEASVTVIEGTSFSSAPTFGEGQIIKPGATYEFEEDEDGAYIVVAVSLTDTFTSSVVTLLAGNTVKVTIE